MGVPRLRIVAAPQTRPADSDRDPCAVETAPLAELLADFVDRWMRTRPGTSGQFTSGADDVGEQNRTAVTTIGPVRWLAAETKVPRRTIQRIISMRYRTTEYRHAEQLLIAIGRPHELSPLTGSIAVIANPAAPEHVRRECCTGCLTGDDAGAAS